jgi:fructose PTS system EIIBC or EIIC component
MSANPTSGLAASFDIVNPVTLSFFLSWPFVNKPILYGVCLLFGMIVTALMVNFLKGIKKEDNQEINNIA